MGSSGDPGFRIRSRDLLKPGPHHRSECSKVSRLATPRLEWLRDIAAELNTNLPRLGAAWCLKNPQVSTVILGVSRVAQLPEDLGALEVVDRLTPAGMTRFDRISRPVAD